MLSKPKEISEIFGGRFNIIKSYVGGMAEVLILRDIFNKRIVAAKTPHIAEDHFSRESRLWLGLGRHPNIVRAHTVYNFKNRPFLFMDFIGDPNGRSRNLRTVLEESANKLGLIIKSVIAVLRALKHAESVFPGFVHRDLKPENILIDANEKPYVSDFGIGHIQRPNLKSQEIKAKHTYNNVITGSTILTKEGSFVGTPGYAAPEQYFDSSTVTFKSDLYSLGIILFEAITGSLPFPPEILERNGFNFMKFPFKKPSSINNELQTSLWNIAIWLLAFNPADRPESFESVEGDLLKLEEKHIPLGKKENEQTMYKLDEPTLVNRVHSFIELNEYQLATSTLFQLQKKHPLSLSSTSLIKKIFNSNYPNLNWDFLKKVTINDLSNPLRVIIFLFFGSILICPFYVAFINSYIQFTKFLMAVLLILIIFLERYINSRTSISLDKITLTGIVAGITITLFLDLLNFQSIPGSLWNSIIGALIGLSIPFILAWSYSLITKKEGIGGGTIKLLAMIGSWVGLMILQIMLISAGIMIIQIFIMWLIRRSKVELKWKKGMVAVKLLYGSTSSYSMPTSTSIFIATWLIISLSH